jgi:hypothetical protein
MQGIQHGQQMYLKSYFYIQLLLLEFDFSIKLGKAVRVRIYNIFQL